MVDIAAYKRALAIIKKAEWKWLILFSVVKCKKIYKIIIDSKITLFDVRKSIELLFFKKHTILRGFSRKLFCEHFVYITRVLFTFYFWYEGGSNLSIF
jgi:hypothetical protein